MQIPREKPEKYPKKYRRNNPRNPPNKSPEKSPDEYWSGLVISFQKIYGLYGLEHVIKVKRLDVTPVDGHTEM